MRAPGVFQYHCCIALLAFVSLAGHSTQSRAENAPPAEAQAPASIAVTGSADNTVDLEDLKKMRDPFKRPEDIVKVIVEEPKTPLELFNAEAFKMIGVLTGPERVRAMLQGPDGKTYLVSERMRIGQRKGVIRRISADRVHVREKVANVLGQLEEVDVEIRLLGDARAKASIQELPPAQPAAGSSLPVARPMMGTAPAGGGLPPVQSSGGGASKL